MKYVVRGPVSHGIQTELESKKQQKKPAQEARAQTHRDAMANGIRESVAILVICFIAFDDSLFTIGERQDETLPLRCFSLVDNFLFNAILECSLWSAINIYDISDTQTP